MDLPYSIDETFLTISPTSTANIGNHRLAIKALDDALSYGLEPKSGYSSLFKVQITGINSAPVISASFENIEILQMET